ncbi:HlyD family efflux transporter periplasmic adaptor subunit [Desulfosarcina sp. OttesenSCG-928-A07]|nr:HlyD family efflux transporter periplasmic adaptor subunit [Desulfosarcina sp. OttesenSCG-928-G17]MDL2329624.1 HlyD family efflux transporter periplasmic adaptor subunit [Desulfosarcina sp. OttesenSCG-928-A07]
MKQYGITAFLALLLAVLGGCGESNDSVFQGYVEGEYLYLASPRAGRLEKLLTERGHIVETGALLFELEAEHERYVLRQAEHELLSAMAQLGDMKTGKRPEEVAVAEAQLDQAKAEAANVIALLRRREKLIAIGGISKQELDDSRAAAQTATARVTELARQVDVHNLPERKKRIEAQQASVKAAEARVAQASWELEQKRLNAPTSGLVYDTLFRQGEWVSAGNPVVQMLPPENVKIRFFVPEPLIGGIRLGSRVQVMIDGREAPISAAISYVAANAEYTPPVIYSNETRSKLVFMVEARPELTAAASLHPGQPVSVSFP